MHALRVILTALYLVLLVFAPALHRVTHTHHVSSPSSTCCSETHETSASGAQEGSAADDCPICQLLFISADTADGVIALFKEERAVALYSMGSPKYLFSSIRLYQARAPPTIS